METIPPVNKVSRDYEMEWYRAMGWDGPPVFDVIVQGMLLCPWYCAVSGVKKKLVYIAWYTNGLRRVMKEVGLAYRNCFNVFFRRTV